MAAVRLWKPMPNDPHVSANLKSSQAIWVGDVCEVWIEWEYVIKHFTGANLDVGGTG
jgi:hypothetical protein